MEGNTTLSVGDKDNEQAGCFGYFSGGSGEINEPGSIVFLGVRSWWPLQDQPLLNITYKIDRTREMRGWLVIGLHGMHGEGWYPITTEKDVG